MFRHSLLTSVIFCLSAISSFAHGDLHEQIAAITVELEKDPNNAVLYHKRGELHRAHCEYPDAFKDYDAAERIDLKLDVVHLSRGQTMLEAGRFDGACSELTTFLSLHPDNSEALLLRGRALNRLGRYGEAEADYAKATELSDEPSPDLYLERAANRGAANEPEAALNTVLKGIERLGPLVTLQNAALDEELTLHWYAAALVRIDAMLRASPRKEFLLERKGRVLLEAGRKDEAHSAFRSALGAIELLPPTHRRTKAVMHLEDSLRSQIAE